MAGLLRGIKAWAGGKRVELKGRAALVSAIQSGEESEVVAALAIARNECLQRKGGLALSREHICEQLGRHLTLPLPKANPRDKEEVAQAPPELAEKLGHGRIAQRLRREAEKYASQLYGPGSHAARAKAEAHRGRSTSDRADVARGRLRAMQARHVKETQKASWSEAAEAGAAAEITFWANNAETTLSRSS